MKKSHILLVATFLLLFSCNYSVNFFAAPKGVKVGEGIQVGIPNDEKAVEAKSKLKLSTSAIKKLFTVKELVVIEIRVDCLSDSQYLVDFSNLSAVLSVDGSPAKTLPLIKDDDMAKQLYIDKNSFVGEKFFLNDICDIINPGTYQIKFHYKSEEGESIDSNELKLTVLSNTN